MKIHNRVMGSIGGCIIALMMLLVVSEVMSRIITGRSIEGVIELVGVSMAMGIFFGFSPCEERDQHVRVELVVRLLPSAVSFVVDIFVYILAITIVLITTYQVGLEALSSWSIREVLPGVTFHVPVYPAKIACFFGYLMFAFELVLNLRDRIKTGRTYQAALHEHP